VRYSTRIACLVVIVLTTSFLIASVGDGEWLNRVPAKEQIKENPYAGDSQAAAAGAKLFGQHCATCHGKDAEGKNGKPSLHSERLKQASPGDIHWLLTNGSLKNGMPSWARLPEQQRWQIVTYLKSIQ
jgi:mono/diheme cytochrome c family protein